MIYNTATLNRDEHDVGTCIGIMLKHTNITDRHVVTFRSTGEQTLFQEKMRRVSVDMINYYLPRMDNNTRERARKTLKALGVHHYKRESYV